MKKTFTYQTPKENCTAQDLAGILQNLRGWMSSAETAEMKQLLLENEDIKYLINTAFSVSLKTEEGKSPCLRLFIPKKTFNHNRGNKLVIFKNEILFNAKNLAKLSPIANDLNYALLLRKGESRLLIDCMLAVNDKDNFDIANPMNNIQPLDGLIIRIDGPGNIRFHYEGYTFELREGFIEEKFDLNEIPFVSKWYEQLYQLIKPKIEKKYSDLFPSGSSRPDMQVNIEEVLPKFVNSLWEYILAATVKLKKGGAYAILPLTTSPEVTTKVSKAIEIKYPASNIDIADQIVTHWIACLSAKNQPNNKSLLEKCSETKTKLFNQINALINLSQADGCVVLDRNINFQGFGGFIKGVVDERSMCLKTNPRKADENEEVRVLDLGGARHQSAYSLCKQVNDALVFMVSQDGEIKVFTYQADCVNVCKAQGTSLSYEW